MAYILDALVILILVFCVWRGYKHGLIRTLVMLVGFVLAAFVAGRLSGPIAGGVYDGVIGPHMEETLVSKALVAGNTQVEVGLDSLFGDNEAIAAYFADLGLQSSVIIGFDDLSEETVRAAVQPAMTQVVRPAVVHIMTVLFTLLLFVILLVAVFLLSRFLDAVFKLPLLKQLNQFGGLAAGVLQGVFWALVFAAVVRFVADCGALGSVLTVETVEQTWLTTKLASWNWIF